MKERTENYLKAVRETILLSQQFTRDEGIEKNLKGIEILLGKISANTTEADLKVISKAGLAFAKFFQNQLLTIMIESLKGSIEDLKENKSTQAVSEESSEMPKTTLFDRFKDEAKKLTINLAKNYAKFEERDAILLLAQFEKDKKSLEQNAALNPKAFSENINKYREIHRNKYGSDNAALVNLPTTTTAKSKGKKPYTSKLEQFELASSPERQKALSEEFNEQNKAINASFKSNKKRVKPELNADLENDPLIQQQVTLVKAATKNLSELYARIKESRILLKDYQGEKLEDEEHERTPELETSYLKKHGKSTLTLEHLYTSAIADNKEFIKELSYLTSKIDQATQLITDRMAEIVSPQLKINELKQELAVLAKQYSSLQEEMTERVNKVFLESLKPLLKEGHTIEELTQKYGPYLYKITKVADERDTLVSQLTSQDAYCEPGFQLETARINKQIQCTKNAIEKLESINIGLTEKLSILYQPMIAARNKINNQIKDLGDLIEKIKKNPAYEIIKITSYEEQFDQVKRGDEEQMGVELEKIEIAIQLELGKINNEFLVITARMSDRVTKLIKNNSQATFLPGLQDRLNDLIKPAINSYTYVDLDGESLENLSKDINRAESQHLRLESPAFKTVNQVLKAVTDEIGTIQANSTDNQQDRRIVILTDMQTELTSQINQYLNLTTATEPDFKNNCLKALTTNVTEENLKELTNKAPDAWVLGNFGRFLLEICHVIADLFEEKPPRFRAQFFASETEVNIAKEAKRAYEELAGISKIIESNLVKSQNVNANN